jgi:hypothetical protein
MLCLLGTIEIKKYFKEILDENFLEDPSSKKAWLVNRGSGSSNTFSCTYIYN